MKAIVNKRDADDARLPGGRVAWCMWRMLPDGRCAAFAVTYSPRRRREAAYILRKARHDFRAFLKDAKPC